MLYFDVALQSSSQAEQFSARVAVQCCGGVGGKKTTNALIRIKTWDPYKQGCAIHGVNHIGKTERTHDVHHALEVACVDEE